MSTVLVEQALQLPAEGRGQALLTLEESQWFERKGGRVEAKTAAHTVIAFANAEGGVLLVGASGGKIDGVTPRLLNDLQQLALDHTEPTVSVTVDKLEVIAEGKRIDLAVLRVRVGDGVVHATKSDKVYLRVGDENRHLSYSQRRELSFDRGQAVYERTPADVVIDDVLAGSYADSLGASEAKRLLQARGLLLDDGRATVGSALLFGIDPQAAFPHAHVRVLRHRGTVAHTGSRQQLLVDERVEGELPAQIARVRELVKEHLPTRIALGADGRFGPIGIVPEDAWMEGLVNAVVHRSYSAAGDHIRVAIFDDRIEFESPGRFPGVVDLGDPPKITRFARNPRIARVLADLRFGQELGEGIRRMFEEMRLAGLADPEYHQTAGSVQLVLRASDVERELDARLPKGWRAVMQVVREGERVSTGEIMGVLDLSRPTAIRVLRSMRDAGLIEWVGKSDRDPRAFWKQRID